MEQRTYLHHFYSPSKTAKESLFFIETVAHYWCDKSFFEDSFFKQDYHIMYVVSGKGYVYNQNEKILVTPGGLLFINSSLPYKFHSHKKDPWEFYWIYFGGRDADWYYQAITNRNRIVFKLPDSSKIPEYLDNIFNLYEQKDAFLEIKTSCIITNLLTDLYIESKMESNDKKNEPFDYPDPVKTVIDYIETNYFRKITLNDLAAITFLSPYYLLRLFKRYTGYTPVEYANKFRIDYSKDQLLHPEITVGEVAMNVGFYTHSYFSKIFKKSTGLTPEEFRKVHLR